MMLFRWLGEINVPLVGYLAGGVGSTHVESILRVPVSARIHVDRISNTSRPSGFAALVAETILTIEPRNP